MQRHELEQMGALEADHWWYAGKRHLMRRLLGRRLAGHAQGRRLRILDVGCGTGANAVEMSRHGDVFACDRSLDALGMASGRGAERLVAASAPHLPFADGTFDVVTAYDILEHVEDDAAFLADLARVMAPGGALAIHVPAWPSQWSGHDVALEHKRRYTRRSLRRLLAGSGLEVAHLGWASCALFLPWLLVRTLRRVAGRDRVETDEGRLPPALNRTLRAVYSVEAVLAATVGLPFGVSLAAVVVKPLPGPGH